MDPRSRSPTSSGHLWMRSTMSSLLPGLLQDPLILAGLFLLLVWLIAEWTARRDADQIAAADGLSISREQGAVLAGLAALWIVFRGGDDDD